MEKAVFLDRDGVINPPVFNPVTLEYESPHYPEDYSVYPMVLKALKMLNDKRYHLFIISNQPSYAKGKTSLENIQAIERLLAEYLSENGISVEKHYYCYHHPDGIVAEYSGQCKCRKPGTFFLEEAIEQFNLNAEECWFIGDRDTDVACGKAMRMRTIQVKNKHGGDKAGKETPDVYASDIYEAVLQIVERGQNGL
jgi:D-glycero-D-manno-heptose 1,7-bisphosphate phosphatase